MSGRVGPRPEASIVALTLACVVGAGCDRLRVESFHGSRILMTLSGVREPTPAGRHLELWVRSAADDGASRQDVLRILATEHAREGDGSACLSDEEFRARYPGCSAPLPVKHACEPAAFALVPALGPFHLDGAGHAVFDDPCLIDEQGHPLMSPDAIDPATGQAQGELGARALLRRAEEFVKAAPAFALVTWDDYTESVRPRAEDFAGKSPAERLCACRNYWNVSAAAYTANPRQLTRPLHGGFFGLVDYTSVSPPAAFGGMSFPSSWALPSARELWLTETEASIELVDPDRIECGAQGPGKRETCRGRVLLDGFAGPPAGGTIHFELASPLPGGPSGSATILYNLDQDPAQL